MTGDSLLYQMASRCGGRLCELQGEMGQWWWHYDPRGVGQVVQAYPVCSVHQYGMGPVGIETLMRLVGGDAHGWRESMENGERWLDENVLGVAMVDHVDGVVWDCVDYNESRGMWWKRRLRSIFGRESQQLADGSKISVKQVMRPFGLGWGMYVAGLRCGELREGHLI